MGSFFAELKRRQMFRVAAAYAVVAWLILQVINNLAPGLNLPNWAITLVIVLLAAGFPIALVFAWIQQLAPADAAASQKATTRLDYALIGALVLVIGLISYQQLAPASRETTAGQSAQAGNIAVAVLPFENLSGDANQEFFSDGVTEEISSVLTRVPNLQVVARTSAFAIDRQNRTVSELGQALGATHLIDGSVRRAGNRVRITAQLVRVDNGLNLWSENFDRELTDIFAIQEDIARAIAGALRVPLGLGQGETLVSSRAIAPEAYEQFLRAKALVRSRGTEGVKVITDAIVLLEQVLARDSEFSPAWALLAHANALTPLFHPVRFTLSDEEYRRFADPFLAKAEAAAQRAIQWGPNEADGYAALGSVQTARLNPAPAAELFSKALALDPTNPDALNQYAFLLGGIGRLKEALATRQKLHALEPLVPRFNQALSYVLWLNGQDSAARAIMADSGGLVPHQLAMMHAAAGRFTEAADALLTIPQETYAPGQLLSAVRLLRMAPLPAAPPESLPSLGDLGFVYTYVGAPDRVPVSGAFSYLWHPSLAPVRKTQRFKERMRSEGVLDYWRAKGWPDLCRPIGADDFECD